MALQTAIPDFDDIYGSLGATRVRETFNPSGDQMVAKLKRYTADLIDLCNEASCKSADPAEVRLWRLAMTAYEEGAMWAVKAATAPKGQPPNVQPGYATKQPDRD